MQLNVRINAENPEEKFHAVSRDHRLKICHLPGGNGVRIDSAAFISGISDSAHIMIQ